VRRAAGAALAALLVNAWFLAVARPAAADTELPAVRRVLVISLPGVTWEDVKDGSLPAVRAVADRSAVADLAVRVQALKTRVDEGYATVGAGTRAVAHSDDAALAFEPHEPMEADDAADAYARITGHPLTGAAAQLRLPELKIENVKSLYHAKLARLGEALAAHGVARGVIANSDVRPVLPDLSSYHREALLALMGGDGQVPCGAVGDELLRRDA